MTHNKEVDSPLKEDQFGSEHIPPERESERKEDINDYDIFKLAANILSALALIFILGMIFYMLCPYPGATIFDACKTILPPIATLVIGYYFGEKNK